MDQRSHPRFRYLSTFAIHDQSKFQSGTPKNPSRISRTNPSSKSIYDQWCRVTAWHGILDLHLSKNAFMKISWLLVILFSAFVSINQCTSLILDFAYSDQWVTSVTYESAPQGGMVWPNMQICNLSPRFESMTARSGMDDPYMVAHATHPTAESLAFYDAYQASEPIFSNGNTPEEMLENLTMLLKPRIGNRSFSELMSLSTVPCNRTAIHCGASVSFDLRKKPPKDCCDQKTVYKNCFYINSEISLKKSYKLGREFAAYFLFDPHVNDYYKKMLVYRIPSAGLAVNLFYGDPDLAMHTELVVAPGSHTLVSLVRQRYRTVARRLRTVDIFISEPCDNSFQYVHFDFKNYSSKLCGLDCMLQSYMRICGCSYLQVVSMPTIGIKECIGKEVTECYVKIARRLRLQARLTSGSETDDTTFLMECTQNCKEACEYDNLDMKISTAQFPAPIKVPTFTTYLNRAFKGTGMNFSQEETRQLIFFEMFYELRQIRVIEKVTKTTITELVSNIGGILGVWTGVSILSMYQCLIYTTHGLCCRR